jgi:hypothetical protein
MLQIDDTLISLDIIEKKFACDILHCKGACCIEGDSGAPLEPEEAEKIKNDIEKIKPYLQKEGSKTIDKEGVYVIDSDGDMVTPLIDGAECAFTIFNNGIAQCGIEIAWQNGHSSLRKPISCWLYPVRINKYKSYSAVNYHKWDICKNALIKGTNENVPLYVFLKEPLIQRFDNEWYEQLKIAAEHLNSNSGK